ncbi:hypothetical protein ACFLFF_12285 [Brevibacillus reuszeri]|uniref:hypothetical protein n=1 Tax=Brevibacillus reuszeri TaxID=54915 RepID=UPI003670A404
MMKLNESTTTQWLLEIQVDILFKMELVVNSVYKDGNGTIGRVNFSDYKWRDRLTDYISETGMSYYGGGNKKLLTGTLSETPKVTATSGAIADGVHYGNTDSITLTLK